MTAQDWDDRIRRANVLAERLDYAIEPLTFYSRLLRFQQQVFARVSGELKTAVFDVDGDCPFHSGTLRPHLPLLIEMFPSFLSFIKEAGTESLSFIADELLAAATTRTEWAALLEAYWSQTLSLLTDANPAALFFPKAFLQPYAEFIAERHRATDPIREWEQTEGC